MANYGKWLFSILCGIAGSFGGFFAKIALQPKNDLYATLKFIPYGEIIEWTFRGIFILLCAWANIKMVEYKIRSFAAIGSSVTVIIAFLANYIWSLL